MSSFQGLPREIMQKCVEFLPFDFVTAALKSVSKATRGAARRALTRGRWWPIRYVAEQGLAVCAVEDEHCILSFAAFATPGPSAAASATFRAAWAIDPGLVFRVISEWDVRSLVVYPRRWQDIRPSADSGVYQARFLLIVERSMDGLSRIVSAWEDAYIIDQLPGGVKWPFFTYPMLRAWAGYTAEGQSLFESGPLIGTGLEAWVNPQLAARFTCEYLRFSGYGSDTEMYDIVAQTWSDNWGDRMKAGMFVAEMGRIRKEISRQLAAEHVQQQDAAAAAAGLWGM